MFWQSLVVSAYRSFFYKISEQDHTSLALACPESFQELGLQKIICEETPQPSGIKTQFFKLKTWTLHVQIVLSIGLGRALKSFFGKENHSQKKVFFSVSEPYSLTALWHFFWMRLTLGKDILFILYTAQNIVKPLNPVLRRMQAFLFRNCSAIASCGREQDFVLRQHGYKGTIIPFPLWYDSAVFYPRSRQAAQEALGEKLFMLSSEGSERPLVLGYAGLLAEQKGILDLLTWLKTYAPSLKQPFCFLFAGKGPLNELVLQRCSELQAQGMAVHSLGPLKAEDMPFFLSSLDILIMPSRTTPELKEQFGRILIEAKACRTLTIGSDSGAIPDTIGRKACIFPEGDLKAMHQLIQGFSNLRTHQEKEWEALLDATLQEAQAYSDQTLSRQFLENLRQLCY